MKTHPWMRGCALLCLALWLTGCAPRQVVRTETVEVKVPVHVALPAELTTPVDEPDLPAGPVAGQDVSDLVTALRVALRLANAKIQTIGAMQPTPP